MGLEFREKVGGLGRDSVTFNKNSVNPRNAFLGIMQRLRHAGADLIEIIEFNMQVQLSVQIQKLLQRQIGISVSRDSRDVTFV